MGLLITISLFLLPTCHRYAAFFAKSFSLLPTCRPYGAFDHKFDVLLPTCRPYGAFYHKFDVPYISVLYSTVLLFYCSTVLLFYCSTVLLFYCSTVLLFYCSTVLSLVNFVNLSIYQPCPLRSITTAVISIFTKLSGISVFHPKFIN